MRTLWCIPILGWPNLRFALPERDANHIVRTQSGFATPRFCIPRTRCEPCGAHLFWVGETWVSHSQNEMRTLWCILILGWRYFSFVFREGDANHVVRTNSRFCETYGFAFPERAANPMVHTHSGLAKPKFGIPRTRCEPYGAQSFWVGETSVLHSQNEMRTLWPILILGLARLKFGIPSTRCEPYGAYSFRLARLKLGIPTTRCEPYGAYSCWVCEI
jgi:hypothetical protein